MIVPRPALTMLLTFLSLALVAAVPAVQEGPLPFPDSTITVKTDDSQFFVRGRCVLPRNAKVALLRRARVEGNPGKGEDGAVEEAVIEVSGTLELKAVTGGNVILRNVWLELTPECKSIYLADVNFVGGGGIRASEKGASTADVYIENVEFTGGATLSMACSAGTITVSSVHADAPAALIGAPRSERVDSKANIRVLNCQGGRRGEWKGMAGGLTMTGVKSAVVQFSYLGGKASRFADNGKLSFQGNNVQSKLIEFEYSRPGQFKKAAVSGCDFRSDEVRFLAPINGTKTERVAVKDCWFTSGTDAEAILTKQVLDTTRNEKSSAAVSLKKIKEAPVGLGGNASR